MHPTAKKVVAGFLKSRRAASVEYSEPEIRTKMETKGYSPEEIDKFLRAATTRKEVLVNTSEVLNLPEEDPREQIAVRFKRMQPIFEYLS